MNRFAEWQSAHKDNNDFDKGYQLAVSKLLGMLGDSQLKIKKPALDLMGRFFYQAIQQNEIMEEYFLDPEEVTFVLLKDRDEEPVSDDK